MSQKFCLLLPMWVASLLEALHVGQPVHLLADCIARVSVRYFIAGRTVVFSSSFTEETRKNPATETIVDIENNVIKSMNAIGRWPITVHRPTGNVMGYNSYAWTNTDDKHYSYILILSCRNGYWKAAFDFVRETIMQLKNFPAWNSRARFLVVVRRCVSNDIRKGLKIIVEYLWRFKAFNVIFLYPSTHTTVEIYTWFPRYLPSTRCGLLLDVVHLDTWVREYDTGFFLRNITLYTDRIPRDLHGCILRASAIKFRPYIIWHGNETIRGGLDVQVLRIISEKLNASLLFRVPSGNERKGQHLPNGTWTGLKAELIYDKADIVIGCFLLNYYDYIEFDNTNIYHTDGFTWVVARATPYPRWLSMGRVFTPSSWLLLLMAVFLMGFIMKYLAKSKYFYSYNKWDTMKCILTTWATFLGAGVPEMPRTDTLRILLLSWMVYSLATNTVFQAFFTSYEVDPGLHHQLDTVEELLQASIIYAISPALKCFFTDDMLKRLTPLILCEPISCLEKVATVYNTALFMGRVPLGYHREGFLKKKNRHEVHPFREDSFQLHAVMMMQKGSPLLKLVNEIITRIVEAGLSDYWLRAIIEETRMKAGILELESLKDSYIELNVSHLQGAFIFLFIGIGLSVMAFLSELSFGKLSLKCR
ncbi:uncharacterized protein LOC117282248 [Cryptotermes secundus]|nr:uncharacterized protein LOC117282248 [Cryptotermes secundus]